MIAVGAGESTRIGDAIHGVLKVNKLVLELIPLEQHFGSTRLGIAEHGKQTVDSVHLLGELGDGLAQQPGNVGA